MIVCSHQNDLSVETAEDALSRAERLFVPALVTPLNCLEAAMKEIRNDAPIDEVRELRRRISARFDHDPARLVAYYMELQEQYRDRLIDNAKTPDGQHHTET